MFILTGIVVEFTTKPKNSMDWTGSKADFFVWMVNPNDVSKFFVALTFWLHCVNMSHQQMWPTEKGVLGFL